MKKTAFAFLAFVFLTGQIAVDQGRPPVEVADLATNTDGMLITWDSSGDPASCGPGTVNQYLASQGAGAEPVFKSILDEDDMVSDSATDVATQQSVKKYVDDNAGAWVRVSTQTASGSATIDFTTLSASYRDFKVIGSNVVPATDSADLFARISVAAAFKSGGTDYSWADHYHYSAGHGYGGGSDAGIRFFLDAGSAAGESLSFEADFFNPADTAVRKQVIGFCSGQNDSAVYMARTFFGSYTAATSAIDGIRFLFISGNIESGTFTLYGRSN